MAGNSKKWTSETYKKKREIKFVDDEKKSLKVLDFDSYGDIAITLLEDGSFYTTGFFSEALGRRTPERKNFAQKRIWFFFFLLFFFF